MKKRKNKKQNMYNSIQHPLLSVDIIESAIQGEKWAKQKILLHYCCCPSNLSQSCSQLLP